MITWTVLAAVGLLPAASWSATVERRLALMGTEARLTVEGEERSALLAASERAVLALEAAENRLSTWRGDSELTRLNRVPSGTPFALSPELAGELAAARRCWEITGGAFDPAIGSLVEAWRLRDGGRRPSGGEARRALSGAGMAALELTATTAVRGHPELVVEEGAFGKGAGLDRALAALSGAAGVERAAIDLGGQVALLRQGADRQVAVADPLDRQRPLLVLDVGSGSVATTGNSERGLTIGGQRFSHVLDPRNGRPVPDFGSLTVWAPTALEADCLSTGLYVLGPDAALRWAAEHPPVEVVVTRLRRGGFEVRASAGWRGRLRPVDPDEVEVHFEDLAYFEDQVHFEDGRLTQDGTR